MRVVAEKAVFALAHALLGRAVVLRPCGVCLRFRCVCAGLLHPERRTPRRGPHLERSVVPRKNFLQERQQRLAVALYGELLHREVAGRLGVGIEVRREVARADGRADNRERAAVLREHLVENRLPIRLAQRGEGIPAEFASAHAESEHRLVRRRNVEAQVCARGLRRLHGRRRVAPALGECRRPEFNALRRNGATDGKQASCQSNFLQVHIKVCFLYQFCENYSKINQSATGNTRKNRREKCATTKIGSTLFRRGATEPPRRHERGSCAALRGSVAPRRTERITGVREDHSTSADSSAIAQ